MKLFAYILDTECIQAGDDQLRVVVSADDLLKKKVLSQSDSLAMMAEAAQSVTGQVWQFKVVDQKEAASLRAGAAPTKGRAEGTLSAPSGVAAPSSRGALQGSPDSRINAGGGPDGSMGGEGMEHAPNGNEGLWDGPGDAAYGEPSPLASTGDEALDRLLDFGRETGIPIVVQDEEG